MKRKRDSPDPATTSAYVNDGNSLSGAEFEVFLSFRGPDNRLSFTDCLYHSLVRAGIRVFRDDEEIRKGEEIGGELLHAIKSSKIYVPIFSRNYASSAWCLRELSQMVECSRKPSDKVVLPIFYEVDPDDVKLKTRLYLDALEKHEEKFSRDVPQWKEALMEVARIKGWATKDKGHGGIINTIVDEVFTKLKKRRRSMPDHLIGFHDRVEAILDLLNKDSHDVSYLIIHGMGGIGKTTLASAVFNQISSEFQGSSFLADVRESAHHGRMIELQKQLILEILQRRDLPIHASVDAGIDILRERFRDKKVLIVLDDVDKWDQLSKLAGKSHWFGPGSKIIITTRDVNFLPIKEEDGETSFQACSEEFKIYEMTELNSSQALQLFSKHAFGMDSPPRYSDDISQKIACKTGGLPLALEVIGSSLFGKCKKVWKAALKKLVLVPQQEVFDKLKISYDMLQPCQREIFLDIACYFIGRKRLDPYYMWKASNYFPKIDIVVLARMSLIKIKENDTLWMHGQLRDFAREIIQREDIHDPAGRSRLWESKIALNVVQRQEGTDKIVALRLTGLFEERNFTSEEFSKLPNLRFLELDGGNLIGDFKNLLLKLTWLSWSHFPSELKAKNLCLEKLAVLKLSESDDIEDWAGWEQCLVRENLRVIHIAYCPGLERTPDFSKCENLKRLVLQGCTSSLVVDGSLSKLEHLKHLTIKGMHLLESNHSDLFAVPSALGSLRSLSTLEIENMRVGELHYSIGEMTQLTYLSLSSCLLRSLPDSIGKLKSLLKLDLARTQITKLPHSIGDLRMLTKMSLSMTQIKKLPSSIGELVSLVELDLKHTHITELPACIGNLKRLEILDLRLSAIRELPKAIGMLENLKKLDASFCMNLEGEIPSEIGALCFLRTLNLSWSKIRRLPTSMNQLSHLQQLRLDWCDKIQQLPELPKSLKELEFSSHLLWNALDLSYLTNLVKLSVTKSTSQSSEFGEGAPNIEWIEELSKLESLCLYADDVTFPPIDLATLSRLRVLQITCVDLRSLKGLPSTLEALTLYNLKSLAVRLPFSNLTNLSFLRISTRSLREVEFDDVPGQQLEKLRTLDVRSSELLERLSVSGLSRLKGLKRLIMFSCPRLMEIQGLEKLESLETLVIHTCKSLKKLSDLSELKKLQKLRLRCCPLVNLPELRLQTHVSVNSD